MERLCQDCKDEGLGCFYKHLTAVAKRLSAGGPVSRIDALMQIANQARKRQCPYVSNPSLQTTNRKLK